MSRELAALGRLHREHVLNPITALAFYTSTDGQKYLLAGEDTDIKVYHVQTSRFYGQLPVFKAQSIHGIAVPLADISEKSSLILVWGGYSVKILSRDTIESLISKDDNTQYLTEGAAEARAPDWIFDGRVSPFSENRIVLLTAHNEVIQAHVDPGRSELVFDKILSPSRPILYSGNFFWLSRECVLVAAGTVFGEILVWKCHLGVPEQKQDCEVLFVFTGHEGSIFGVHISPEIRTSTGENLRLLASCSDDRTIRVWDITERHEPQDPKQNGYETHISDARETGFGNNVEASAHDDFSTRCLATVMGHASRIWQVEFPQNQLLSRTSDIIGLYSFGEDATAQKWNLSLNLPISELGTSSSPITPVAKLTHQATFSNHSGKHIWSHAITFEDDDVLVATGGSDGKIALIGAGIKSNSSSLTHGNQTLDKKKAVAWSLPDVLRSSQAGGAIVDTKRELNGISNDIPSVSHKPKNAKEAFNRYTFVSDKRLLAATNSGRIFAGSFENDFLTWIELALPDEIGQIVFSHALHGTSPAYPLAFIGTSNGYIYYYSESGDRSLQSLVKVDGKVADIFWLSDANASNNSQFQIFVTILRSTNAVIIHVDPDTLTTKQISVTLEPGFMVTAAAFVQGYLVLGSRKGIIAVFSQGEDGNYSVILTVEVHRDEAITSLLPLHSRDHRPRSYILSTCRDGRYRIHEISTAAHQSASAVLIHEALPPFVSSVEGAWFANGSDDGSRDLMLCGFRSSRFVVWNESRRHEVATVDCGGSSRSYAWAPIIRSQPDGFRFVFTKAGQMHVFSQTHAPHRTLRPGGHGREIKAVSASSGRYVATAAEDTVVRIWEYGYGEGEYSGLGCVAALERHATGIQALKWIGNEYLFSSGGNEEFFVWRLNKLESDDFTGLAIVCEAVFPDRSEIGDARITDFDVTRVASDGDGAYEFTISMALSNSTLQTYAYSKEAGFLLQRRWTYTGACLTQVRHLGSDHILTAATDGYLAIYANTSQVTDENADTSPLPIVTKLHQNTIKALDIRQVSSESDGTPLKFLVVTGGDDNALGITYICIPSSSAPLTSASSSQGNAASVTIQSKSIIRSAHAAGITGTVIARLDEDGAIVVTGSNDQRVRVWRLAGWNGDEKENVLVRAQLLEDRYSAVADTGGLEVFEEGKKVIVVGVGLEVWDLKGI
ncbi:WD40 repeat-like protein [Annulohypoxylon moriforme]|nr:WD40 repeat-like protein [Annulohypoxylon moriforme]